jgi:xyloglucan-specific exo-beta-1,4-glucanase
MVGDMNTYGTVYMSTNGRGVAYGKIDPAGDVQVVPQVHVPPPGPNAECKYVISSNVWWGGGIAEVSITNKGSSVINGWNVSWTYSDDSAVQGNGWNGFVTGSAPTFSANDAGGWNRDIYPGQTASVGFVFSQGAQNPGPAPVVTGDVCK